MIFSKCSLRVSLAGGSTDLQEFINHYGYGSVINFPCSLYTYISVFHDKNGYNRYFNKYIINYKIREEEENVDNIKNDIAKEVLKYFDCPPLNIGFNADIFSEGSGLASSSSYLLACIKAISAYKGLSLSEFDICSLALKLERKFNPLTGYQDIYGCGLDGFKKLTFRNGDKVEVKYLNKDFLKRFDMFLLYTGVKRKSTDLLSTYNLKKIEKVLPLVEETEKSIENLDVPRFLDIIKEGWARKKETSPLIVSDSTVSEIDDILSKDETVLAHRLCGAGNGGYFLIFKKIGTPNNYPNCFRIDLANRALTYKSL